MKENYIDLEKINIGFGNMADEYDALQDTNLPIKIMRKKFYETVTTFVKPPAKMLELNCGTGIDAHYFALQGFDVTATDISDKMLLNAKAKGEKENLKFEKLSLHELDRFNGKKFDIILSNLGGLNCLSDLSFVSKSIAELINPGGFFIASVMPRFSLWEFALLFKFEFKRAFRRIKKITLANVGGEKVPVRYYSPKEFYRYFNQNFELITTKALRIIAPPQPASHWYKINPGITKFLDYFDNKVENIYVFSFMCDYFISVMKKPS